ncbi:hypothetical protein ABE042_21720 [Viridibacillus arvi]|uniref:hypothetical protein n=1 Tax=Viridibacillus arvi TaxID=263475 RepID=UPI003D2E03CC
MQQERPGIIQPFQSLRFNPWMVTDSESLINHSFSLAIKDDRIRGDYCNFYPSTSKEWTSIYHN